MASQTNMQQTPVDCSEMGIQLDEALEMLRGQDMKKEPPQAAPMAEDRFMVSSKAPRERRNWKRFTVSGAVVTVAKVSLLSALKPSLVKIGPLKDIGMKGLAVHYGEKTEPALKKAGHLSITFPGEGTVVDKIPFKIVNNFRVAALPNGKEVWSLCVSFGRLLPMQKSQIEALIEAYGDELPNTWSGPPAEAGA